MKIKTKLLTMVSLMALTAVMLVVGVWALKTVNFTIDGNLSYIAPGIEATISKGVMSNGVWVNAGDASTKMPLTQITRTDTEESLEEKFSYWQNINLNFNEAGDDIKITFSITNNSTSKYIILDVSTSYTSADNCTISVDTTSKTLDPQGSHTFTLTMSVTDKTANATMTNFAVVFNMQLSDTKPSILKQDEKGFYVTMGTYNENPVIWRLVGLDGEKFTGTTAPTSGTGTFILETYTETTYVFNSSSNNDYATSDIRTYLTKESVGGYIKSLNISATDEVYSKIKARDIQDLYVNIGWAVDENELGGDGSILPEGVIEGVPYTIETTAVGEDKLWLMSIEEIFTLVGGGSLNLDGTIPDDWYEYIEKLIWKSGSTDDIGVEYWLRSPAIAYASHIYEIYENGEWSYDSYYASLAVRPAFNLEF